MLQSSFLTAKQQWVAPILNRLEQFFWPQQAQQDSTSVVVYLFKPFPASLKTSQRQDWATLQLKVMSPFSGGDSYYFISSQGVSMWCSPASLSGIPETALQSSFDDGEHRVQGKHHCYIQQWRDGVMRECLIVNESDDVAALTTETPNNNAWAKRRRIDQMLVQPITWFAVVSLLFLSALVWQVAASVSLMQQAHSIQNRTTVLEEEVGGTLAQQAKYQAQQAATVTLIEWQRELGFLPQTLAEVAAVVMQFSEWKATNIQWQTRTLIVELELIDVDITALVSALEDSKMLTSVAIRPHARENTWQLEVVSE